MVLLIVAVVPSALECLIGKMCTHQVHIAKDFAPVGGNVCILLPTGSEEREVLRLGSIPVAILLSCHYMRNIAL